MSIKPTVGRKVWYRPSIGSVLHSELAVFDGTQPLDATVVYVWHDRMVNLLVVGPTGIVKGVNSVTLLQDDDAPPATTNGYAEWMPFQQGQARASQPPSPAPKARLFDPVDLAVAHQPVATPAWANSTSNPAGI